LILFEIYLKNFYGLAAGEKKIEPFILRSEKSFDGVLEQLETRKKNIEKRLIEVDKDSESDRIRLRGEIDGINYAISTVKSSQ
jgi:hypothetical protein